MTREAVEHDAMRRALVLAATHGVPLGPNPRVGCVLIGPDGSTIAEGYHRGAGTPHAEADALSRASGRAAGATAVVTLEPCNHTGRTGPCAEALVEAGIARVVVAQRDPNPVAQGGTQTLRAAGIEVVHGLLEAEAALINRAWSFGIARERPLVTWKYASTLDGRTAASDGSSRWISSARSRADVHRLRASCDVVLAGTGTVLEDDPLLTVRDVAGQTLEHQPLRVVVGERDLPADSRVLDASAETIRLRTRDLAAVLRDLFDRGRRHVLLEGGPTLAAAFVADDLVDEVVAYVAPTLLGAGTSAVGDLGIRTIAEARHYDITDVRVIEAEAGDPANVRITMTPRREL